MAKADYACCDVCDEKCVYAPDHMGDAVVCEGCYGNALDELQRFRAREPLVQELLSELHSGECWCESSNQGCCRACELLGTLRDDFSECIAGASAAASIADDLTSGDAPDSTKSLDKASDEC